MRRKSVNTKNKDKDTLGIIGLGYVGLPLALSFSKKMRVVAFDKKNQGLMS